jgi:phage tail-like protein
MDVQGSQYHLIFRAPDWGRCVDVASGLALAPYLTTASAGPAGSHTAFQYDDHLDALRLRRDTPLFRRAGRMVPLDMATRRGAGRDGYGNWYWIDEDRATIRWRPTDDHVGAAWWSTTELTASCATTPDSTAFSTCAPPPPESVVLQGLTVTTHHYLVAGFRASAGAGDGTVAESGLLVFDLHGGGPPLRLLWPMSSGFVAWDLADTSTGGVLVLDRDNSTYWELDARFRLRGQPTATVTTFQPVGGGVVESRPGPAEPLGYPLFGGSPPGVGNAVSIEPGPAGTVLILDAEPARGYSTLYLYDGGDLRWATSLADAVEVIDPQDPTDTPHQYSLLGHDFVYLQSPPATGPLTPPMLYIADAEGKQAVAFTLDPATGQLGAQPDFLPLRRWDGKASVRSGPGAWYDFRDRWVPLEVFTECRFQSTGTLTTPADFAGGPDGQPFDSQTAGCVWHRLMIDAEIPTGTSVTVRARASDDPNLLLYSPWIPQPTLYQRSDGSELAWSDPWVDRRDADGSLPDRTGTWELLFQQITGRFLQVELGLHGGGRSSPALRSLRAWYPRFSYPEHYLPAVYQEDAAPGAFLDRFLANFEGFCTTTEERIEHSHLLLDARTAPVEDLAWLACWFGLVLDPKWDEARRRFLIRHIDQFYRQRGTVAGLVSTLRVYLDQTVDDSLLDCAVSRPGGVRLVERFLTRTIGPAIDGTEYGRVAGAAHRFDVLIPAGLPTEELAMVGRIVEMAKPGHTWFDIQQFSDLFIVGAARLGIDTQIGHGVSFTPMMEGKGYLGSTYLGFPYPFDIPDRVVVDRERVGALPPL